MAKSKRNSHRVQASRLQVAQARYAVKHGLISNRAKITKDTLSRNVSGKLESLRLLGALPDYERGRGNRPKISAQPQRVPVRVYNPSKYRAQDYSVFGNFIVTSRPKEVRKDIQKGGMGGTTLKTERGPTALKSYTLERINLSRHGIRNFADLKRSLKDNNYDDILKHPDDLYTFKYFNNIPNPAREVGAQPPGMPFRGHKKRVHPIGSSAEFLDGEDLLKYLEKYDAINADEKDAFDHFILERVHVDVRISADRDNRNPKPRISHHGKRELREAATKRRLKAMQAKARLTEAQRKAEQRARETPEQTALRRARDAEAHRRAYIPKDRK